MEKIQEHWGPLAAAFFFGGSLGAMLMGIIAVLEITGSALVDTCGGWLAFAAVCFIALGGICLFAELGNKVKIYHLHKPGIMTAGALSMVICAVFAVIYVTCFIGQGEEGTYSFVWKIFFWRHWAWVRPLCAVVAAIFGLILVGYPGPEMHEASGGRPFWKNMYGLILLFLTSALAAASAFVLFINEVSLQMELPALKLTFGIATIAWAVITFAYILAMKGKGGDAARSANNILAGGFKWYFWILTVICGMVLAIIGAFVDNSVLVTLGAIGSLVGTCTFRFIMLLGGLRITLPGEEIDFYSQEEIDELHDKLLNRWEEKAHMVLNK